MINKTDFIKICSLPQYGLIPNVDKTSFYCNNIVTAIYQVTKYNFSKREAIVYSECYCYREKVKTKNIITTVTTKDQLIRSLDKYLKNYKLALIEFKKSLIEKDFAK